MGANMKCDKRSFALLSSKRTKAYTRTKADEAFALPSFPDAMPTVAILPIAETETTTEDAYAFPDDAKTPSGISNSAGLSTPVHYCNLPIPNHGMEQLKQTMIHQESLFKAQLGELHRLYHVQKSLMSEWSKKGAAAVRPHPDPPLANSSVLQSVDVSRQKNSHHGPNRHGLEIDVNQTPLLFPTRVDMNKPFEDVDRIEGQKGKTVRRPLFDLEQPAEVYIDEIEDKKLLPGETTEETENKGSVVFHQLHERYGQSVCPSGSKSTFLAGVVSARTTNVSSLDGSPLFSEKASSTIIHSERNQPSCTTDGFTCSRKQQPRSSQDGQKGCWLAGDNNHGTSKLPHWLLQASSEARNRSGSHSTSFISSSCQQQGFFPQEHKETNQFGSPHSVLPGGIASSLTTEKHRHQLFSSETNIHGLPLSKESPNNGSGLFVSKGVQEMQRPPKTLAVDAPFQGAFASRGVEEMQQAPTAPTINIPSFTRRGDDARGLSTRTCFSGQMHIDEHTSSTSGTPDTQSMYLNAGKSSNLSRMPPWLQPKLQQPPNVQQTFDRPTNAIHHVPHLDVSGPQYNDQLQNINTLITNNKYACQLHGAAVVFSTSWADVHATKGNVLSVTSNVEQQRLGHTHQMKDTPDVREYDERWGFRNGQKIDKTDLNTSKIDFDLNVTSEELSDENVVEIVPKESRGLYAKLGIKISNQNGQKTLESSLKFQSNSSFDCSAKEPISGVTGAVVQVLDESSQHYPKGTFENTGCGSDVGGHYEGVKSSDGSGLTSESQEAVPLPAMKAIEDSNASSGDQSGDSIQNVVTVFSLNVRPNERTGMLSKEAWNSLRNKPEESSRLSNSSNVLLHDLNEEYVVVNDKDISDVTLSRHALEAAEVLFRLGSHSSVMVAGDSSALRDQGMSLKWLADMVYEEENDGVTDMDVDGTALAVLEVPARCSELSFVDGSETALDSFELAVLSLKPVIIEDIEMNEPPVKKCEPVEESNPVLNSRRRSSRRGKANKDFQRDVLPNMACLSRHEVSEDLQIIEGLLKSATETTERCDSLKEEESLVKLETGSAKQMGKVSARGTKSCKGGGKQNPKASSKVCSWGESTRRKRMRRERSQWMSLPS